MHLLAFTVAMFLWMPCTYAAQFEPAIESQRVLLESNELQQGHINERAELQSLIRTDRRPRSWKSLKLKPGKIYRWYYAWIMPDGSTVTKIELIPIKGIQDDRPLSDSHPNSYLIYVIGSSYGSFIVSGALSAFAAFR